MTTAIPLQSDGYTTKWGFYPTDSVGHDDLSATVSDVEDYARRMNFPDMQRVGYYSVLAVGSGVSPQPLDQLFAKSTYLQGSASPRTPLAVRHKPFQVIQNREFEFKRLTREWHKERVALSSITDIAMCPSYQKILAMGKSVLPLIFQSLEAEGDEPDMWFWALRMITDEDPITDEDRGDIVAMANAWLRWGRERYDW